MTEKDLEQIIRIAEEVIYANCFGCGDCPNGGGVLVADRGKVMKERSNELARDIARRIVEENLREANLKINGAKPEGGSDEKV